MQYFATEFDHNIKEDVEIRRAFKVTSLCTTLLDFALSLSHTANNTSWMALSTSWTDTWNTNWKGQAQGGGHILTTSDPSSPPPLPDCQRWAGFAYGTRTSGNQTYLSQSTRLISFSSLFYVSEIKWRSLSIALLWNIFTVYYCIIETGLTWQKCLMNNNKQLGNFKVVTLFRNPEPQVIDLYSNHAVSSYRIDQESVFKA